MVELERAGKEAIPIELLEPGDFVRAGGRVKAILKLLLNRNDIENMGEVMFRYNSSVCVTGSHAIPDPSASSGLMHVQDSRLAIPEKVLCGTQIKGNPFYVYNLVTEYHKVVVNATVLADWDEADTSVSLLSERNVLYRNLIASHKLFSNFRELQYIEEKGGFAPHTMVTLKDGMNTIPMNKVEPGDLLKNNDKVIAVVRVTMPSNEIGLTSFRNVVTSPLTKVYDKYGQMHLVQDLPSATRVNVQTIDSKLNFLYHLITESQKIDSKFNLRRL